MMICKSIHFRRSKRLVVYLVISVFLLFCIQKWNTWFGNPVEPAYTNSSELPTRIQLTLGNDGLFSRNVSWQCGDSLANSYLLLVKTATTDTMTIQAEGKMTQTQGGKTVSYHVHLSGLTEGDYSYRVCTNGKFSNWFPFSIFGSDHFRFIFIGDIQDTIGGITGNLLRSIFQREKDAAFWILGGDLIERPHDSFWNEYFSSTDSIAQTVPMIACPGNHEYRKGIVYQLDERFVYTFSYLIKSRSKDLAVFDTRFGHTHLITLDSNCDSWKLLSQRKLLKEALEKAHDAPWKIVIIHHPLYSVRGKFRHFLLRKLFDPLIRQYGVDLVLQGHEHCYARSITKNDNNLLTTPVYIISHFSPKSYRIKYDQSYDRLGSGSRFYQTFDVTSDSLCMKTFTEEGLLFDHIRMVKGLDDVRVKEGKMDQ